MEQIEKNEARHIEEMIALMQAFLEQEYAGKSLARMFHPKLHACVRAELRVEEDLPEILLRGLFDRPGTYPAWLRFSNAPPRQQADYKASGRGVAIKIMEPAAGANPYGPSIQDFLLTTSPVLSPGTVRNYKRSLVAITKGFPHNVPYLLTPTNWRRVYLTLKFMRKHQNLLDLTYFSGSPFLFGANRAAKFSLRPRTARMRDYGKDKTDDFLRKRLQDDLTERAWQFDFLVQLREDPRKEPIEDSSREWKTPFQRVATLTVHQQTFAADAQSELNRRLVFSPWNCLPEHRPLGGINRARRAVYAALSKQRNSTK